VAERRLVTLRARLALSTGVLALACAAAALAPGPAQATNPITMFKAEPSTTQAGGHPDIRTEIEWGDRLSVPSECACSDARSVFTHLPTGVIGNPHSAPICSLVEFSQNECAVGSQVGWITLKVLNILNLVAPVYNMQPHPDEAGLIGFYIPVINGASFISLSARTGSDYGLDANAEGLWHALPADGITLNLWGVPAKASHDVERSFFGGAMEICSEEDFPEGCPLGATSDAPLAPYLQNPTTCGVPLTASVEVLSYDDGVDHAETPWPATTGCSQLAFDPSFTAVPTTGGADSPSGLEAVLSVPQSQSATVPSPSELKGTTIIFPAGFSINPNAADGKTSCSDADASFGSQLAAHCPDNAKVGTLEIDSSALPGRLPGAIYLGEPQPGNKYRLILTADGFATHIKLAGSVSLDPQTGQVVTRFANLPQTPLQEFRFHFFGSERGLLATPTQCGAYPVTAEFEPWD
jgi:hypothetical protein